MNACFEEYRTSEACHAEWRLPQSESGTESIDVVHISGRLIFYFGIDADQDIRLIMALRYKPTVFRT